MSYRLVTLILLTLPSVVFGHGLNVYAYVEGHEVKIEAYFKDGSPAQGAKVEVLRSDGTVILEAKTGKDGQYAFGPKKAEALKIVASTPDGHRAEYAVSVSDFAEAGFAVPAEAGEARPPQDPEDTTGTSVPPGVGSQPVTEPGERQDRPRPESGIPAVRAIIGLAIILGLTGLVTFLTRRRPQRRDDPCDE